MKRLWLLFDAPNLLHRSWHAGRRDAGLAELLFLQEVRRLAEQFGTTDVAFCFDGPPLLRKKLLPGYKERPPLPPEERVARRLLANRLDELYDLTLPGLGCGNVFWAQGYEADDLIASAVSGLPPADTAVIVSSDQDLWQLLRPDRVVCYNPHSKATLTDEAFRSAWHGLAPKQWAVVKALAGCVSDKVPGIAGVGEKTAAKYLAKQLGPSTKAFAAIEGNYYRTVNANLPLVRLPFADCPAITLRPDDDPARFGRRLAKRIESFATPEKRI